MRIVFSANPVCDTAEEDLKNVTFKPKLKLFEEDIMEQLGIEEHRKRKPTYWY